MLLKYRHSMSKNLIIYDSELTKRLKSLMFILSNNKRSIFKIKEKIYILEGLDNNQNKYLILSQIVRQTF